MEGFSRDFVELCPGIADLTIMQWNVLSDQLAIHFPACPQDYLTWKHREALITEYLSKYDADIICLEEVDKYESTFLPFLGNLGYIGIYQKKDRWHNDGTAVFIKREKIALRKYEVLKHEGSSQFVIIAWLTLKSTQVDFVVGATHQKAKDQFFEERKIQSERLVENMQDIEEPMIICGDFNGNPDEPFYPVMTGAGFRNAYFGVETPDQEPNLTTYKVRPKGLVTECIDYIWLRNATATSILSLPTPEQMGENALPCETYPSDHLSLVAKVQLK